ncbi:hypothetical protein AAFN60_11995 [Roseibacillus persicicus]|uniref:hypothetical protein n=1 Tax=Roseibacillus persicicus TaxID=454148 RepID=UPI00398B50A4
MKTKFLVYLETLTIIASLLSCTTLANRDYPLVFMDKTTFGAGIELNPSTNTYTSTVGLRARSFALVPVTVKYNGDSLQTLNNNSGEAMSVYTEFGGQQSFLSNLTGLGSNNGNQGGLGYERVFATGDAAVWAAKTRAATKGVEATSRISPENQRDALDILEEANEDI